MLIPKVGATRFEGPLRGYLGTSRPDQEEVNHGQSKQRTVEPVQKTAVSGKQASAVFQASAALHRGFHKISELTGAIGNNGQRRHPRPRQPQSEVIVEPNAVGRCRNDRSSRTLPRLTGANPRSQLAAAKRAPDV